MSSDIVDIFYMLNPTVPEQRSYNLQNPPTGVGAMLAEEYVTLPESPIWEKLMDTAWLFATGRYPDFGLSWHYHVIYHHEAILWIPEEWRNQVNLRLDINRKHYSDCLHWLTVSFGEGNELVVLSWISNPDRMLAEYNWMGLANNKETIAKFLLISDALIAYMNEVIISKAK